jgi:hypothetical protein
MSNEEYVREMLASEKANVRRAAEIREGYRNPSPVALELDAKARQAAEALMDDEAKARVAASLPAWGPIGERNG